jgi:hypothetical protein
VADLAAAEQALATAQSNCAQVSSDHEATVAARAQELKVITEAIEVLKSTTAGGVKQAYSLLQTSSGLRIRTHADLAKSEVLTMIKKLAKQQHSTALAQLASRVGAVLRYSAGSSEGPFEKVKGLINDMVTRLSAQYTQLEKVIFYNLSSPIVHLILVRLTHKTAFAFLPINTTGRKLKLISTRRVLTLAPECY